MEFARITDLKKCFEKWSHGTLYNRLEELEIKDNSMYMSSNKKMYNQSAIELLTNQYIEEFAVDKEKLEKHIKSILSSQDISNDLSNKENVKKQKSDNFDKVDKNANVNNVNFINDNYIAKVTHNEIVNSLNEQIIILKNQLEKANAINEKLADTVKIKEQKELTIEQEKVIELQQAQTIKILENQEQKEERKRTSFFSKIFKNTKGVNE